MLDEAIAEAADRVADQHGMPRAAVKAIITVESSGNPYCERPEPHYRWLTGLNLSHHEQWGQSASWGLMQIMGAVARELGHKGFFARLCDPAVGLEYGCRYLAKLYRREKNWPDTISSYNQGSPRKDEQGRYRNQEYVDAVFRAWSHYDAQIPMKESEA